MEADRAFAREAAERGIDGWVSWFAPDAARLVPGGPVVRGLEAIREQDGPLFADPALRLEWEPTAAGGFADGKHGFTRGRYQLVRREGDADPVVLSRGTYLSIWRRDEDGWKVILDTGRPTHNPLVPGSPALRSSGGGGSPGGPHQLESLPPMDHAGLPNRQLISMISTYVDMRTTDRGRLTMTRWTLSIPDDTDRTVRTYLARTGLKKGDLSRFVDRAVRREVFALIVKDVKERNADADPDELAELIEEAVEQARAHRP